MLFIVAFLSKMLMTEVKEEKDGMKDGFKGRKGYVIYDEKKRTYNY